MDNSILVIRIIVGVRRWTSRFVRIRIPGIRIPRITVGVRRFLLRRWITQFSTRTTECKIRPGVKGAYRGNEKIVMITRCTNGRGCENVKANAGHGSVKENSSTDCNPVTVGTDFSSLDLESVAFVPVLDGNNTGTVDEFQEVLIYANESCLIFRSVSR
jgi:hypothetical protein